MILACLGYNTKTIVTGGDAVHKLLEEFVADPTKAKLVYDTNSGEFIDPSESTTAPAGVHMATRTSVSHYAALLRDQTVDKLVRVTIFNAHESGHLVALGPNGFFLCTCLRQLVYGLLCPHGIKALFDNGVDRFDGASVAPRWRDSAVPWTMEALAAKPARLATTECSIELPPVAPNPNASSQAGPNVKAAAYANGIAFGKAVGVRLRDITSLAGIQRVIESTDNFFKQQLEVEKRSQRNESTSRVFTGATSQPTPGLTNGDAGGTRGKGRARGGTGSRGRGRGAGGRGGRGGGRGQGRAGGDESGGRLATGTSSPIPAVSALQPPAAAAGAGASGTAPISSQTTPIHGAHTLEGSAAPLCSVGSICIPAGGGGRDASSPLPPAHIAVLEKLLPPLRHKQTGSTKRQRTLGAR